MLYLIIVLIGVIIIKFLYDRDKMLTSISDTGGLITRYKTLIDYMLPDKIKGSINQVRDNISITNGDESVKTTFEIIPAFDIVIIKWKFECRGIDTISHKWDFETTKISQKDMIAKIDSDIAAKSKNLFNKSQNTIIPVHVDKTVDKGQLIIDAYRNFGKKYNSAPSNKISNSEILTIYRNVTSTFKNAAKEKNEFIPLPFLNTIVLKFLNVYEMFGENAYKSHLDYEVEKYLEEGLRDDYQIPMII